MNKSLGVANHGGRISFPDLGLMNEEQKQVYDQIVSGPRGTIVGPLRAALHNPSLADKWQKLGQVLRFETSFSKQLNEIAILVTARRWNSALEWAIHAGEAEAAGLSPDIIEAIRTGSVPDFKDDIEASIIYNFTVEILQTGNSDQAIYSDIVARWGEVGVVELTAVIGYYSLVAMTLNVHQIPMPPSVDASLETHTEGLFISPQTNHKQEK